MKNLDLKIETTKNELINLLIKKNEKLITDNEELSKQLILGRVMPSFFRERRKKLGISMKFICDKIGVAEATLSRLENGGDALYSNIIAIDDFLLKNKV